MIMVGQEPGSAFSDTPGYSIPTTNLTNQKPKNYNLNHILIDTLYRVLFKQEEISNPDISFLNWINPVQFYGITTLPQLIIPEDFKFS